MERSGIRAQLITHTGLWPAAVLCLATACMAFASSGGAERDKSREVKTRQLPGDLPKAATLAPTISIPVEPLGFTAPGALYLGERNAMGSLDFIDENRLLLTFRVPGLIRRDLKPGESPDTDVRQIRSVVISASTGAVQAEALWQVHDRSRYLWLLKDGHFLLRDRQNLSEGDASLELKPLLQFPGQLLRIGLDPSQQYIVSNSLEPPEMPAKPGTVGSPATASATITTHEPKGDSSDSDASNSDTSGPDISAPRSSTPNFVVRILRRESGKVMLVSRTRRVVNLAINSEGYLEILRGRGDDWLLNLNFFTGGSHMLGNIESNCAPSNEFLSERFVLATGCDSSGAIKLVGITTEGNILWNDVNDETSVWPVQFHSANGLRIGFETLAVTHAVGPYSPLSNEDIKGQVVRVLDAATGEIAFEAPASPVLDMGGNAALSPSGRRVAVINNGVLQVFDLPAPPRLPNPSNQHSSH
jgi:hypothetical protein